MRPSAKRALVSLAALGLAAVLAACGGAQATTSGENSGGNLTVDINSNAVGTISPSEIADWPSTAPADVPAFPGRIGNLMVGRQNGNGYGVRIFFSDVTTEEFQAYLGELRSAGYKVQGIVYYSSDLPDAQAAAQARADQGQYDAVRAMKDPRRINISVPATVDGTVTYDLDGLTKAENDAMNTSSWPAGWADKIPAPDGCKLDSHSILGSDANGFRLYCIYASSDQASREQTVSAYVSALKAKGFKVTGTSAGSYSLSDGAYSVAINPDQGGHMYIEVAKIMSMANGWPSDWADRVPPPDGCTLGATPLSAAANSFMVACTYPDNDPANHQAVVLAYQAKLQAAGFAIDSTEHDGSQLPNGVSAVTLSKGSVKVRVMPDGAPGGMSISATDGV